MPYLCDVSYSREATIAAVRDYYQFLTKLYLPECAIIEPPVEGWPNITADSFRTLGKTDEVVELLRHLPYIRQDSSDIRGAAHTYFTDWRSRPKLLALRDNQCDDIRITTEGLAYEDVPAHVVGLTSGGRNNPVFLLDTQLGIIYWYEWCPTGPRESPSRESILDDPEDYAPENEEEWRSEGPAWSIVDFFELLKDELKDLKSVPINWSDVHDIYTTYGPRNTGMIPMLQGIYREHGWPNLDVYNKDDCLRAVQKALEEYYPDDAWRHPVERFEKYVRDHPVSMEDF